MSKITKKHIAFAEEYLKDFNGTRAYMVFYPKSTYLSAMSSASNLLTTPKVSEYVSKRLDEIKMSANEALSLMADIARGDIAKVMDVTSMGFNLDMKKAQEQGYTKLIKKVKQKTITKIGKREDDEDVEIHNLEIELYPADAALDKILRVHGKYDDRVDVTSKGEKIGQLTDEQLDRAVSTLSDALGEIISGADDDSGVDTPE